MRIREVIQYLESIAPPVYQESYDNSGLLTGNREHELSGVLIALDCIESVIDEAIDKKCNLVIAHHPIVFSGLKSLTGKNYVERTVIKAIKHDISIYAIHTNLDNVIDGVNKKICDLIGLQNLRILSPKHQLLTKLVTFIPPDHAEKVLQSLYDAGAGRIGDYDHCSFRIEGKGSFRPNESASPFIGSSGEEEHVNETRAELMFPKHLTAKVINVLQKFHPYEEVAYYLTELSNVNQEVGSGMIGSLDTSMEPMDFLKFVKEKFNLSVIRHTQLIERSIKNIAVCGGAGSFLLGAAKSAGADVFITADYKYHEFFDADQKLIIADIGHYESEVFTKELIYDQLKEKFANIALNLTEQNTNPINYLL